MQRVAVGVRVHRFLLLWRSKNSGTDASVISQMTALEDENCRPKKMYAE